MQFYLPPTIMQERISGIHESDTSSNSWHGNPIPQPCNFYINITNLNINTAQWGCKQVIIFIFLWKKEVKLIWSSDLCTPPTQTSLKNYNIFLKPQIQLGEYLILNFSSVCLQNYSIRLHFTGHFTLFYFMKRLTTRPLRAASWLVLPQRQCHLRFSKKIFFLLSQRLTLKLFNLICWEWPWSSFP